MPAADGDVHRRDGAAEARGGAETQGNPAPTRLSPNGSLVAVGVYNASPPLVIANVRSYSLACE